MKTAVLAAPKLAATANFNGKWVNDLGSKMDITTNASGNLSGTYQTAVGSPTEHEKFDLVGFISGDLITFSVNFGKYGSLTSWAGQHTVDSTGSALIKTLWLLSENIPDAQEPDKLWGSILAGANNFMR